MAISLNLTGGQNDHKVATDIVTLPSRLTMFFMYKWSGATTSIQLNGILLNHFLEKHPLAGSGNDPFGLQLDWNSTSLLYDKISFHRSIASNNGVQTPSGASVIRYENTLGLNSAALQTWNRFAFNVDDVAMLTDGTMPKLFMNGSGRALTLTGGVTGNIINAVPLNPINTPWSIGKGITRNRAENVITGSFAEVCLWNDIIPDSVLNQLTDPANNLSPLMLTDWLDKIEFYYSFNDSGDVLIDYPKNWKTGVNATLTGSVSATTHPTGIIYPVPIPDPTGGEPEPEPQPDDNIYTIGNSIVDNAVYSGIVTMATSLPKPVTLLWGQHVILGSPLDYIRNNPTSGFSNAYGGLYPNALQTANIDWKRILFNPFDRAINGAGGDRESITFYINMMLPDSGDDTQVFIYERWRRTEVANAANLTAQRFKDEYLVHYDESSGTFDRERQDFFTQLTDILRQDFNDTGILKKKILMVPVGRVFQRFNQEIIDGNTLLTGSPFNYTSAWYLYKNPQNDTSTGKPFDGIHLSNVGRLICSLTHLMTITGQDIRDVEIPSTYDYNVNNGMNDKVLNDPLKEFIKKIVYEEVKKITDYSGYTDVNSGPYIRLPYPYPVGTFIFPMGGYELPSEPYIYVYPKTETIKEILRLP